MTIAIIAIMSIAVSVGFNSFFSTVSVQNAAGHVSDIINGLNQEALRDEYEKSSVYFEDSFLLVDSKNAETGLTLNWEKGSGTNGGCNVGSIGLKSSAQAQLFVRDTDGELLDNPVQLAQNEKICIDPLEHKTREIIYELQNNTDASNKIRIFPINLSLRGSDDISIDANDYRLDILRPYGRKKRYENDNLLSKETEAVITIKSADGEAQATFNLPKN